MSRYLLLLFTLCLVACTRPEPTSTMIEADVPTWASCGGSLTSVESEGFCQDSRPVNWQEFRFNDETWFFVPLAAQGVQTILDAGPVSD